MLALEEGNRFLHAGKLCPELLLSPGQLLFKVGNAIVQTTNRGFKGILSLIDDAPRFDECLHMGEQPGGDAVASGEQALYGLRIALDGLDELVCVAQRECAVVVDGDARSVI